MIMEFKIRKATKEDIDLIDKLYTTNAIQEVKQQFPKRNKNTILEEFNQYKESRRKMFLKELKKRNVISIVGEYGNKDVGFAQGIIEESYGGKMGLIDKIYLNKNFQGKGLGIKFADFIMNEMKKENVNFFEWRCFVSNIGSIKLAEKLSFKPFSIRFRKEVK